MGDSSWDTIEGYMKASKAVHLIRAAHPDAALPASWNVGCLLYTSFKEAQVPAVWMEAIKTLNIPGNKITVGM